VGSIAPHGTSFKGEEVWSGEGDRERGERGETGKRRDV